MKITNADMPAMPFLVGDTGVHNISKGWSEDATVGLTKLEHFAGLAMQGHLAGDIECIATSEEVAEQSVIYAKALLKELEKHQ